MGAISAIKTGYEKYIPTSIDYFNRTFDYISPLGLWEKGLGRQYFSI
jgi:hypothetical protein